MANYRGDDGTISFGGSTVGEILSWSISGASRAAIEDTVKGDQNTTFVGGRKDGGTFSATVRVDLDDSAQASWINGVIDTNDTAAVSIIGTLLTAKTLTASAIATGFDAESPEGDSIAQGTLTAKISGAVTLAVV